MPTSPGRSVSGLGDGEPRRAPGEGSTAACRSHHRALASSDGSYSHPVTDRPRVAVVVLNYLAVDDTRTAVESVQRGDFLESLIVVVDNSPDVRVTESLRAHLDPCVTLVRAGDNIGYAAGNNLGIRKALELAPVDYVWVLNPDTLVAPDALSWLVLAADSDPGAAIVASRLVSADGASILYDGATIDPVSGATTLLGSGLPTSGSPANAARATDYAHGASMLLRTASMAHLGRMTEDYFLYFEETDFSLRARRAGSRILIEPRSVVRHTRRSWGELPTSTYIYYMVRNREIFAERWGFDPVASRGATDHFTASWRGRVRQHRPDLVDTFDALVAGALADGVAGRAGRSDLPSELVLA